MVHSTMKPNRPVATFVRHALTTFAALSLSLLFLGACGPSDEECRAECGDRVCGRPVTSLDCPATSCGGCGLGAFCTSEGSCTPELDMDSLWVVQATEGSVAEDDWDCPICDPDFDTDCEQDSSCFPDPYLLLIHDADGDGQIDDDEAASSYETEDSSNTFSPVWNEDTLVLTASELMDPGLIVGYLDDDSPFSDEDTICIQFVKFDESDFSRGSRVFQCGDGSFFTLALWPAF